MTLKGRRSFGIWFWVHILAIIGIYSVPFTLSWWMIPFLIFLFYLQNLIFGGCVITTLEFRNWNAGPEPPEEIPDNFHYFYLSKIWPNINKRKMTAVLDYIVPAILIIFTLFWQLFLGKAPLIF